MGLRKPESSSGKMSQKGGKSQIIAAEAAAGIFLDSDGTAKSSGEAKGFEEAAGGGNAGLFKAMFHKLAESGDLDWLQRRILELSQQAAAGDITAGHTVAALAPIVHARLHPEEQPAAPDL